MRPNKLLLFSEFTYNETNILKNLRRGYSRRYSLWEQESEQNYKPCMEFSNDFLIRSLKDGQTLLLIEVCEFPVLNARLTQNSYLFCVQAVQCCWSCQLYTLYFCAEVQVLMWYGVNILIQSSRLHSC